MTATKTEPLTEREKRQDTELQGMIGPQQDALNAKIADNELRRAQSVLLDDTAEVRRCDADRTALIEESAQLQRDIEDKQKALAHTRRQIAEARRAANINLAQAHAATAVDIAPALEQSMFDTVDFIKRFADQLAGARKAIIALGDGQPASCPMPTHHGLVAWVVNQLVQAGLPIKHAAAPDGWGNAIPVSGPGIAPVELADQAVSIAETTR